MNENLKKQSELAMCMALEKTIPGINRAGRIKSLAQRLKREAEKEINKMPRPTMIGLMKSTKKVDEFDKLSGWGAKEKHIVSYVSALAAILEPRKCTKVNECLVDIVDHFERAKNIPAACYWSGDIVKEKWERVWG